MNHRGGWWDEPSWWMLGSTVVLDGGMNRCVRWWDGLLWEMVEGTVVIDAGLNDRARCLHEPARWMVL